MRFLSAVLVICALGAAVIMAAPSHSSSMRQDFALTAPEFPEGLEWLNTRRPLSLRELRGKVVLLDFWTYCCINCMHIIPDLKKLEAKYPNELVVIGVHSAKFLNEKDSDNIREAILRYEIEHPVVNDRDFQIWNAYGARAWPTLVLIRPDGKIRGGVSGEGHFRLLDQEIGRLIAEFSARGMINRTPIKLDLEKHARPRAVLAYPAKLAVDEKGGRLFVTDSNHNRIVIFSTQGEVQQVIGSGVAGLKDGSFEEAQFFRPQGVCYDAGTNALYVADTENHAVRKVDLAGSQVTTLAGNGTQASFRPTGGTGRSVELNSPWDVLLVGGKLYVAMAGSHQLWVINPETRLAVPFAGTADENIKDGPLLSAHLAQPSGLTTDGQRLYFADSEVSAVRAADLKPGGAVTTLVGIGLFDFGDVDGPYPRARLQHPLGVAYRNGWVYIADTYNHKIKRVSVQSQTVETFIGTGGRGMLDGPAKSATLNEPAGLAFLGDRLFIADTNNHLIRVFDMKAGKLSTLRLTGLEKLARSRGGDSSARKLPEEVLPAVEVPPGEARLELRIHLPEGTKFSPGAPFQITASSDRQESVAVPELKVDTPTDRLVIPLSPKAGEARISVDLFINYCSEANEGLCYFKETRLVIPVTVVPGSPATARAAYTLY